MSEVDDIAAAFKILALPIAATMFLLVEKKILTADEAIEALQSTASGEVVGPISKRACQEIEKLEASLKVNFEFLTRKAKAV